jgi:hypothetical protein
MAIDHRIGNKVQKSLRREDAPATRVDPHPYIGIVKNNLDPTRCGRLQVWIPDLGGNQNDPKNWRTVSYASPFMGTTDIASTAGSTPNTENKFTNTPHTYGMWMVPPDIGIEVIVIFIAGDPMRGYWIACVNSALSRYMIPAIAAAGNLALAGASADVKSTLTTHSVAPVTEYNDNDPTIAQNPAFYTNSKPVHEPQYKVLKQQGLDRDFSRGLISSSSQRESPSTVFGISTPGRPYNDPADDPNFLAKVQAGTLTEADYAYKTRKGGHSLVMDDGDLTGQDQLVRLRTAGGHQIMMNDSDNTLYINHADGSSWIELTTEGTVNIFTDSGFNVRTQGTLNLHSDLDVNINAGGSINLNAANKFQVNSVKTNMLQSQLSVETTAQTEFKVGSGFSIDAGAMISVKAGGILALEGTSIYQNSGKAVSVKGVDPITVNSLPDTTRASPSALWESQPNALLSIVTIAPTHEPFPRASQHAIIAVASAPATGLKPQDAYAGANDATKTVGPIGKFATAITAKQIRQQLAVQCDCTIGNLSHDQMVALFAQIGNGESGMNYKQIGITTKNYVGKYMFGREALQSTGYVKLSVKQNSQIYNPNSWTGKDGINSVDDWLNNGPVQERAMCDSLTMNYNQMVKQGTIGKTDDPETVAGTLYVSQLLGAGGAHQWRTGAGGADANGTTGDQVFSRGKWAVSTYAPLVQSINQG